MSAKVINLRQARKAATRSGNRQKADENAARFGRSKAQRDREKADATRAASHLDAHERDPKD